MPWLSASVIIAADLVDALSDALMQLGAASVDVADAAAGTAWEQPIFDEPDVPRAASWARAKISALFPWGADIDAAVSNALAAAHAPLTTAYEISRVDDEDWVRRTQSQFTPQHVTERLWIVPTWHDAPDPQAINIVLDPGLAFGTGTHPTTRLCLRWLDANIRGGESVIDFGCGSGILAIAALKLGASRASGVDIDSQAVAAARENALQNGVQATFVSAADDLPGPAQIVVANILAQPLIVLAPLIKDLTVRDGMVALSGILVEQAPEVTDAYATWYDFEPVQEEDGWVLLSGVRGARDA